MEVPSEIKDAINQAINTIPHVSGIEVTEGSFSTSARKRECCNPPGAIQYEKCCDGSLTLSANLGEIEIYGGSFGEIDFGDGEPA